MDAQYCGYIQCYAGTSYPQVIHTLSTGLSTGLSTSPKRHTIARCCPQQAARGVLWKKFLRAAAGPPVVFRTYTICIKVSAYWPFIHLLICIKVSAYLLYAVTLIWPVLTNMVCFLLRVRPGPCAPPHVPRVPRWYGSCYAGAWAGAGQAPGAPLLQTVTNCYKLLLYMPEGSIYHAVVPSAIHSGLQEGTC